LFDTEIIKWDVYRINAHVIDAKKQILPNDENNVVLNSLKLVYCEVCYKNLTDIHECWQNNKGIKITFEKYSKKENNQ
jgi:uncharacterized protein YbcV (DUF1398 family)